MIQQRVKLCLHVGCLWGVQTDGRTPLYAASNYGHVEVAKALVGAGAAVNQADVRDHWLLVLGCAWLVCFWIAGCWC
jgi:hypothetical protein